MSGKFLFFFNFVNQSSAAVGLSDVRPDRRKYTLIFILTSNPSHFHHSRSESPSSQRSSPPISPGCEDQLHDMHDPFKKPFPPMRPQEFPPFYSSYPYHLMQHSSSAFHRPLDASGKPIPVSSGNNATTTFHIINHIQPNFNEK